MAEALYRKYRPQIFEDVVGQEHIERTIKNAIEQDKVSHAYLFTGPRGTGKTTTARLLAKALLCQSGPTPEPDGVCDDCEMIANGTHPDVYELDAASRTGVENVREEIIGRVQFAPTRGRYKIYVIDEVHMLSTAAFNALLKTLEEPPSHVVFILATTDPQKVPETIHSRCQRFDFRRISSEAIVSRLGAICVTEDVEFEGEALDLIAHRAEGGMRNALTSLEQLIAFGEGKVTLEVAERMLGGVDTSDVAEIVRAVGMRDVAACFRWTADYVETGADLAQFVRDLAEHVRNMYVMTLAGADVALEVSDATRRELEQEMQWFGPDRLSRLLGVLGDLSAELKTSTNPRLSFEIALTRMVRPDSDLTLETLAERLEALENGHSAVAHVTSAGVSQGVAGGTVSSGLPAASAGQQVGSVVPEGQQVADTRVTAQQVAPTMSAGQQRVSTVAVPQQVASPRAVAYQPVSPSAAGAQNPSLMPSSISMPSSAIGSSQSSNSAQARASVPSGGVKPTVGGAAPAEGGVASAANGALPAELLASLQNPAALQRIWQAALSVLKKNKAAYGVLFLNTKALYQPEKGQLVIEFPVENEFAFKAVQKLDVQDAVRVALTQACGAELPFVYTKGSSGVQGFSTAVAAVTSAPSAAPTVPPVAPQAPVVAQPSVPSSVSPVPDPTPLDAYDFPSYEGEVVPYDDGDAPGASSPAQSLVAERRVVHASAPTRPAVPESQPVFASVPTPTLPPEPDTCTSPSVMPAAPAQSQDEIEAMLAAGFGDGVIVEEVRE